MRDKGRVKWFNPKKGYGFITKPDGTEIFFHLEGLRDNHAEDLTGTPVTFDEITTSKGAKAVDVVVE